MDSFAHPAPARRVHWRQALDALPRETRDTLFLLCVIAWISIPLARHMPLWALPFVLAALLWRARLALRGQALPGRWALVLCMLLAVALTGVSHGDLAGRDPGVTLIMVLLALKTLEMRARRDALVVFFLGFFVLLSNFFYSQSLLLTLALVLGLLGLLTALVNAHMTVGRPPLLQATRVALRLMLWGAPVMVALFVLFPRIAPLWGVPEGDVTGKTGLSDSMRVGSVAHLALDDGIAFRLRFENDQPPPANTLYFRGPVLSWFDGTEWRRDESIGDPQLHVGGEAVRYQMTIEPSKRPWLTLLDATPRTPALPPGVGRAHMGSQLQWSLWRPITDVLRLEVESYTHFRHGPLEMTRGLRRHTRLPPGLNPRTRTLARELLGHVQALDSRERPRAMVEAALQRLRQGGYYYTLEPELVDQVHTADDFWFDSKAGFCEHIAAAFVILMRQAGVPARIVLGYQGGERNTVDGYWVVRQADAHAWSEVWLPGEGWVRVDPTAAVSPGRVGLSERLQAPRGAVADVVGDLFGENLLRLLRTMREAVDNGWKQWVLNYTQSRQFDLLDVLGWQGSSPGFWLRLLGAGAGAGLAWWVLGRVRQYQRRDEWLHLMARVRTRLRQAGLPVADRAAPRTLAQQLRAHFAAEPRAQPKVQALCRWLLDMERQRYASPASGPPSLPALRRQWRSLPWPQFTEQKHAG